MTTPHSNKLEQALAYGREGFKIFPIRQGTKNSPLVRWVRGGPGEQATADPETIKKWWTNWPDANIGIATGPSLLLVVDVDMKEGKNGEEALMRLERQFDALPKTREARTPTGGKHLYFTVTVSVRSTVNLNNRIIGDGLDIRSEGGMVVATGSETDKGAYTWINPDMPIAEAPKWLVGLCGKKTPGTKTVRTQKKPSERGCPLAPVVPLDDERAVEWAIQFLRHQSGAIQGKGGDHHTYVTVCGVKDQGVSHARCLTLLLEHWNDRCEPPWRKEELKVKVDNAYAYGSEAPGSASPLADFEPIEGEDLIIKAVEQVVSPLTTSRFLTLEQIQNMPPASWLIEGFVPEQSLCILYGAPGTFKTFLALDAALCVANGRPFFNRPVKAGVVFYLAGESPAGFRLRIAAWEKRYGHTSEHPPFYLQPGGAVLNQDGESAKLAKDILAISDSPKLIVVDTLQVYLEGNENSPEYMGAFIRACVELREKTGAAVVILHHLGKDRSKGARGHTSLAGTADAMFEMAKQGQLGLLRCTKMKEADDHFALTLQSVSVVVDPDGEFQESLVLTETDQPFDSETTKIHRLAAGLNGHGLKELVTIVQRELALSDSSARRKIKAAIPEGEVEAIRFEGGRLWLALDPNNPQGAKTIRYQEECEMDDEDCLS